MDDSARHLHRGRSLLGLVHLLGYESAAVVSGINQRRGRQRFVCVDCGLEFEGREMPDGRVAPYDQAGYDGSPVRHCRCIACLDKITPGTMEITP